jgi:hypothetical protein
VTNCPVGQVTTVVVPVTTTVCPASENYAISTVYTTSVRTVTGCPPTVTSCPVGKVTTVTAPAYTTIYPVTSAQQGSDSTVVTVTNKPATSAGNQPAGSSTAAGSAKTTVPVIPVSMVSYQNPRVDMCSVLY